MLTCYYKNLNILTIAEKTGEPIFSDIFLNQAFSLYDLKKLNKKWGKEKACMFEYWSKFGSCGDWKKIWLNQRKIFV